MSNKTAVFLAGAIIGTLVGIGVSYFGLPLILR